jgi:iron-sulfur cluster assembly protein
MTDNVKDTGARSPIFVTEAAVNEVNRLRGMEKDTPPYLRLGVAAGGCSGMSYTMAFETDKSEFDKEFEFYGLCVLVDMKALMYLTGTTLDFRGGLMGGGFDFSNPRAKRSCGCGSSFTV